jgi:hypothetical protein
MIIFCSGKQQTATKKQPIKRTKKLIYKKDANLMFSKSLKST